MEKHRKFDYFEKVKILSSICSDNILLSYRIISSEIFSFNGDISTGRKIMSDIITNLEKDYFTPFEREDIFLICEKLCDLSDNTFFLCHSLADSDFFGFPQTVLQLIKMLKSIIDSISDIFEEMSNYPKHGDMTKLFADAESSLLDTKKAYLDCLKNTKNNEYYKITYMADKCIKNCKEIIQLTQYILIKNS